MTKAHAIAAWIAGVACASVSLSAVAERECVPSVRLSAAVLGLDAELARRGIAVGSTSDCGAIAIDVEVADDGRLRVRRMADASSGAAAEAQLVADSRAAATLIESWARADLAAPLLATRQVQPLPEVRIVTLAAAPAVPTRRLEFSVASDFGFAVDGSTWTGLSVAACVNVEIVCIGALVRAAIDNRTSGDANRLKAARYGVDSIFTVDLPIRRTNWALYPGLGVGQGAQQTVRDSDGDEDELAGVRVRAHVGIGIRIARQMSLVVNPEVLWSPGNPRIVVDADEGPELFIYPGDPGLHFRLGLGFVLEAL